MNISYYHTPSANHTQIRVLNAKASELADEDLEYLMGNYIKYEMRKDYKNSQEQDENKARQYAYWYTLAKKGIMIEPLKDSVPNEFHFEGLF